MSIPIPKDIPLPLPAPEHFLQVAIIFLFLLHIFFVNVMVGGSLFVLIFEWIGLKRPEYDRLARDISSTITVNKSLAVVLGVGPLLTINVLYTIYFYTANTLTGVAWAMMIPLVIAAFLMGYAHKYSWDRLQEYKALHLALGAGQLLLFLVIPLIFLSNINLMLFPERWQEVNGWLSTLILPNVVPRYLHFILASLAISGLFFAGYFSREKYPAAPHFQELDPIKLRKMFYGFALGATAANFLAGPLLFLTLPAKGLSWGLTGILACGVIIALIIAVILWREVAMNSRPSAWNYYVLIALMTLTVVLMGSVRHLYRHNALAAHRVKMAEKTNTYMAMVRIALWRQSQGLALEAEAKMTPGEKVFRSVCATCHMYDKKLVGPSLIEISKVYPSDPAGIVKWVKKPGRKRQGFPQMPAIVLKESQYKAVAQYILDLVAGGGVLKTEENPASDPQQETPSTSQ